MRGLIINELTFEDRLAYDEIFVEYFNAFLALPAFPKVVQYNPLSGAFQEVSRNNNSLTLQPSDDAENESKKREKVMKWVKRERLPLFLRTRLFLEFKLCRLLIRKLRDSRSTAPESSRGLRGYSRATSSTIYTPHNIRPSSNTSNRSWPGVPIRHFGRRPLGSATSLPGMLRLAVNENTEESFGDTRQMVEQMHIEAELKQMKSVQIEDVGAQDNQDTSGEQKQNAELQNTLKAPSDDEQKGENGVGSDLESDQEGAEDEELRAVMEFGEADNVQAEADVKSIASKHKTTLQELKEQILGSLQGMTLFRAFLEDTLGIPLYNFWLDVERYKDSLQSEPEESIRELRTKLFRDILDKYKNYLTADAKEQIDKALFHGGVTQDLFTRTQYDMLRRMRSYWVPRFLVHLERNEEYRENYFAQVNPRDQYRPNSSLSFFPSLSLVHSIPPLGDWCREMIRSRKWDRDILIKDKRKKSVSQRLATIREGDVVDPFVSALKAEKDAGYPFKRYLQSRKEKSLLSSVCFWLDVKEFYAGEKRSRDRYLSRCTGWTIFNNYLALVSHSMETAVFEDHRLICTGLASLISQLFNDIIKRTDMNIGEIERKRIESILQSSDELPLNLFSSTEKHAIEVLRHPWEDFKDFDLQRYRKPPRRSSERTGSPSLSQQDKKQTEDYYSPTTGRWVKRHPGSSPSQRGRRLYTSLAVAEEIDADRSFSSSPKRSQPLPQPSHRGKKNKASKAKKKAKTNRNVTFRKKKKVVSDSEEDDDSDSSESKQDKPAKPVTPDFVDVVENKGTMASFKQYVQNMEGRQALNQLVMYLEIEQYFGILPSKKSQKSQQATNIYKTFIDPSSRRSVSLPSLLIEKIENDRPSSPVLTEAQQAVKADVESYFKTFFRQSQEASSRRADGTSTPNTPGQASKTDGIELSQSFLQFYKRKAQRKSKNTGRVQPTKEDREDFKRMLQSTQGRLPVKLELFRRYLQNHGDPDTIPKLENDLMFYLEVQKLKDLFNYLDDASLNKKVETIIECFLDSASPPWLQIDIGAELASKIIHKAQMIFSSSKKVSRDQKDPGIFDEAQSIVFKEVLPYWAGFCKTYKPPEDENTVKLPPTKQEKNIQRRYNEYLKYQAVTETLVLPPVNPTTGQSKSEATFTFSDGMRWKDRREVDTASVVSSVQGSVSGTARKTSTIDGSSVQQIEVGS